MLREKCTQHSFDQYRRCVSSAEGKSNGRNFSQHTMKRIPCRFLGQCYHSSRRSGKAYPTKADRDKSLCCSIFSDCDFELKFIVDFDPQIFEIAVETKYFEQLGFPVPSKARNLALQASAPLTGVASTNSLSSTFHYIILRLVCIVRDCR